MHRCSSCRLATHLAVLIVGATGPGPSGRSSLESVPLFADALRLFLCRTWSAALGLFYDRRRQLAAPAASP